LTLLKFLFSELSTDSKPYEKVELDSNTLGYENKSCFQLKHSLHVISKNTMKIAQSGAQSVRG